MSSAQRSARSNRLTIELDPGGDPIRGWVQQGIDPWQVFEGMTELIAVLDSARQRAAREGPRARESEAPPPAPGPGLGV